VATSRWEWTPKEHVDEGVIGADDSGSGSDARVDVGPDESQERRSVSDRGEAANALKGSDDRWRWDSTRHHRKVL
jgi:hypothetical protein